MSAAIAHHTYSFTLRSVAPRDALVFKSIVRVLSGKTRHLWEHTDDRQAADVVVLGDHLSDFAPLTDKMAGQWVIHISSTAGYGFEGLSLPLRIGDVIAHLDRAGEEITKIALRRKRREEFPSTAEHGSGSGSGSEKNKGPQRITLKRWPETALLRQDIRYLKLATALTGNPVSIDELAVRTKFPTDLCQDFVDSLNAVQLLRVWDDVHDSRISPSPTVAATQELKPAHKPHGLIARIRSRLEMFVGTSAAK